MTDEQYNRAIGNLQGFLMVLELLPSLTVGASTIALVKRAVEAFEDLLRETQELRKDREESLRLADSFRKERDDLYQKVRQYEAPPQD